MAPAFGSSGDSGVIIRHGKERSELELVNMRKWTMRGLRVDSVRRVEETLAYNLYLEGSHLRGTVSNSSPMTLKQVWLIASGMATDLGGLGPGETATVDWPLMGPAEGRSNSLPLRMLHETIHSGSVRSGEITEAEDRTRRQFRGLNLGCQRDSVHRPAAFRCAFSRHGVDRRNSDWSHR